MTTPISIASYSDCVDLFERAIQTKIGIRIEVADYGAGKQLSVRLHTYRKYARERSMEQYEPTDPAYGTSGYDSLTVREPSRDSNGTWWVRIEPKVTFGKVEEIAS